MDVITGQPAYPYQLARNFPLLPDPIVDRDNVIGTLTEVATVDSPVIFLEGAEGRGATTLLAQFTIKHAPKTFCLFLKPASRLAYSPDYLRLVLAEQYWWHLYGTRLEKYFIDPHEFDALQLRIRKANRTPPFYIVVDGIHQIPKDDFKTAEQIFRDVLPIGVDGFRFIVTGEQSDFQQTLGAVRSKTYQTLKFSDTESAVLLSDISLNTTHQSQLISLCSGVPGRLASVQRLIAKGITPESILDSSPDKYLKFISLEFSSIDELNDDQKMLLAILAFSRHTLHRTELLGIWPTGKIEDIEYLLSTCVFLVQDEKSGSVEFRSEAHRRFAESALAGLRQRALTAQVDKLIQDPNSAAAVRLLPGYYHSLNQQQAIVDLISKEHYSQLLDSTESISALRARAGLGAKSAMELKQATDIFKFSLQRSIFSEIGSLEDLQSEVGALVALGNSQKALDLATQATTKERRMFLLAEFARQTRELGNEVDAQIVSYIRELAKELDFGELGANTLPLAENLLFVDPDLALQIVDAALKAESSAEQRDAAFARLSLAATLSGSNDAADLHEKPRAKISDEALQSVLASLSSIFSDFSYEEIVRIAERMDINRRIYFLRSLVAANTERAQVLEVVDYALDQLVRDTMYSPKAKDLADLAKPLSNVKDSAERVLALIKRIESQIGLVEKGAPSRDLVALQMNLAHAELRYDRTRATERISEAYYQVASIENAEIQALCFALMSQSLSVIDQDGDLEAKNGFRAVILDDLKKVTQLLLRDTANHLPIAKPTVVALAASDPDNATLFVDGINTSLRRDGSYKEFVIALIQNPRSTSRAKQLTISLSRIDDQEIVDATVFGAIETARKSPFGREWLNDLEKLLSRISDPRTICEAEVSFVKLLTRLQDTASISNHVDRFDAVLNQVDSLYERVDLCFELTAVLAKSDLDRATRLYEYGVELRGGSAFGTLPSAEILRWCLSLILRTFRPLIRTEALPPDHLIRFSKLCDQIPCTLTKLTIYCDLACKAWCEAKHDLCRQIVNDHCRPLLDDAQYAQPLLYKRLCVIAFPALYGTHPPSANILLPSMPIGDQEAAIHATALMILRKIAPSEPGNDSDDERAKLSHGELTDFVELLKKSPTDTGFYSILQSVTTAATNRVNKTKLSGQQKADFSTRVNELIKEKLPDKKNIQHDGFLVASFAQTARLTETRQEAWAKIIDDSARIDNLSDRSYVLLEIANCLPSKLLSDKKRILQGVRGEISKIPAAADRFYRLESYIRAARKIAPADARAAMKEAMTESLDTTDPQVAARYRRNLLDIAEAMDSSILDDLAEMIDDDPARAEAKADLKRAVEIQKLKKKLSAPEDKVDTQMLSNTALPDAAWKNVVALSSDRIVPQSPDDLSIYVDAAGNFSIDDAYPVLSWYIENSARRFTTPKDVESRLLPLSEVLLLSTEIAVAVISQPIRRLSLPDGAASAKESISHCIVVPKGERHEAINFLKEWIRTSKPSNLVLCDPYFCQLDVEFLRLVLAESPRTRVTVLTSKKAVTSGGRSFDTDGFLAEWNEILDQEPPETEIVAINGSDPIEILVHDRWLLSDESGLRLGTSFGGFGNKLSEISVLSDDDLSNVKNALAPYLSRQRIAHGVKVQYMSINL